MTSPLEKYDQENEARWEVLSDVPEWEVERIFIWISGVTHHEVPSGYGRATVYDDNVLSVIQRKERIIFSKLGIYIDSWTDLENSLEKALKNNPEVFMLVVEALVKYARDNADSSGYINFNKTSIRSQEVLRYLENILSNGSRWRVVTTHGAKAGIEERASEQITNIAKNLSNNDLTEAWNLAYGRQSDTKLAIEKAQNAIEYFATKSGLTTVKSSVYGNLLGDVKKHPGKYESAAVQQYAEQDLAHNGENPDGTLNDMMSNWFWTSMNLIQKTNVIRHKNSDNDNYVIPVEAARQAVLMATLLCEYIEKGYFKKGNHRNIENSQ